MTGPHAQAPLPAAEQAQTALTDLRQDDFALLGLPWSFALDEADLNERRQRLQRLAHPDQFSTDGAVAQRVAMQWSVRINEAYQRLRNPISRAAYLCECLGAPIRAEVNTAMPAAFLMQQMALREALDDAGDDEAALQALLQHCAQHRVEWLQRFEQQVQPLLAARQSSATNAQPVAAEVQEALILPVRALMFVNRFEEDVHDRLDALLQS